MSDQLPTEPGYYLDVYDNLLWLSEAGRWREVGSQGWEDADTGGAPLIRLFPLSVEERTRIAKSLRHPDSASLGQRMGHDEWIRYVMDSKALAARIAPDQNGDRK